MKPVITERGVSFQQGPSFYRAESALSRDLACLSAWVHKQQQGSLRCLDLMAGSGVRSVRYLEHSQADSVWANDYAPQTHASLHANLSAAAEALGSATAPQASQLSTLGNEAWEWRRGPGQPPLCTLSHVEASKLLMWSRLQDGFFDLIDADSFGADTGYVGLALGLIRYGGMLCLTSTAGPVAGGRDPLNGLAMYGAHLAPVPHANEQGLRMLLGLAAREAMARRLAVTPLWSLYSPHGPVWRIMMRVEAARSADSMAAALGYVRHARSTGESGALSWEGLQAACSDGWSGSGSGGGGGAVLSGPLWLAPLHDPGHLRDLRAAAASRGWLGPGLEGGEAAPRPRKGGLPALGRLLELMEGEAEPLLSPWYTHLDEVARQGRLAGPPGREALAGELRARGFAACATHIEPRAVKTNATMAECVAAAGGLGIATRRGEE